MGKQKYVLQLNNGNENFGTTGKTVQAFCAIGDTEVEVAYNGEPRRIPYASIVAAARDYIRSVGGFEPFAEWGLV